MVGIRGNHPQMESNGHQPDDMSLSENLGEHPHLQWTIIIAASLSKWAFEGTPVYTAFADNQRCISIFDWSFQMGFTPLESFSDH